LYQWEERGEVVGERGRRVNMVQKCVHLHVKAKMIPDETIPGMRGERKRRAVEGVYLTYYKKFCKCHDVPPLHNKKNFLKLFQV
jgi:hypothetical protein